MSEHTAHSNAGPGYETTDVHTGPIYKFVFGLVLLMVVGIISALGIFKLLDFRNNMDYADMKSTNLQQQRQVPAGPLLQVTNHSDLVEYRSQEAKDVSGHATWLDKNAKVVRLPLDRAIDIVAERGLPVFKGDAAAAAPNPVTSTPAPGAAK